MTGVHVSAERPYDVVIERGALSGLAGLVPAKAERVAILHPAVLRDVAAGAAGPTQPVQPMQPGTDPLGAVGQPASQPPRQNFPPAAPNGGYGSTPYNMPGYTPPGYYQPSGYGYYPRY